MNHNGRHKNRKGIFVAFLGRDGVGKSTLLKKTAAALTPAFNQTVCYYLTTQTLLPARTGENVGRPHSKPIRGPFFSFLKLVVFSLEYIAGYYIKILPALKKNHAVLFDRYYYDLLADSKRYKHGLHPFWAKFFMQFIPKPDITFIVDAPTPEVMRRKQELSLSEHEELQEKYLSLDGFLPNSIIISNEGSLENASKKIIQAISENIKRRFSVLVEV